MTFPVLEKIDLVEQCVNRLHTCPEVIQSLVDDSHLRVHPRIRCVSHVDNKIRVDDLLKRTSERFNQMMGQLADKTYCVSEQYLTAARQKHCSRRGVKCGKEFVLGKDTGVRQIVEQCRFSGIGIAYDCCHRRGLALFAAGPYEFTMPDNFRQFFSEDRDPLSDKPPVHLQFLFTGTSRSDTAAKTRH